MEAGEVTGMTTPTLPVLLDGLANRPQIASMRDIEAIESQPYASVVPLASMADLFRRSAELFGDQTAIIQLANGEPEAASTRFSYRQLWQRICQAANLFRAEGVTTQDAVVLLMPTMAEAHFALWGAELAGKACPVNYMLELDHIVELVQAAGAKVMVALGPDADFDIWAKALAVKARLPHLQLISVGAVQVDPMGDFSHLLDQQPAELAFARPLCRSDVAAFYHTGGTTGSPKLAQHTHGNQVHTSWFAGLYYGLTSQDCMLNGFPLFHVAGAFVYGAACFCAGATVLIPPRLGMRHKAFMANHWHFVARYRVTYLAAVPTIMSALLETRPGTADASTVKALYTGGSPLPAELANQFEGRFGIPVRNILGMTESAGLVAVEPLASPRVPLSCGLRLPFSQVQTVEHVSGDANLLAPCPPNSPGIVVIQGPHVSPGYTHSARNRGMFGANGELISGDLGHLDESGRLFLTGRSKDVIIRGAHNIDPSLIEEAFIRHPDVLACAAVGEPDPYAGELPVVFLSLRQGAAAEGAHILAAVAPHIFERAAVPKRVTVLDALPTTAIGKIFKPTLRQWAVEQAFREALGDAAGWCEQRDVVAVSQPGGIGAKIQVRAPVSREAALVHIQQALGRMAVPYEVEWL